MAIQDFARISSLSTQAATCLEKYQATKQENDRIQALEQVLKLARSLEPPGDAIFKLFLMVRRIDLHASKRLAIMFQNKAYRSYGRQDC